MADYAISNVPRRVVYAPSGVGPYAFTFEILSQTDIAVYRGSTLLTLTTDYTVTINANGTGSVTLVLTAGTSNITIVGAKNIQRTTDFTTGGDLFANTLNDELDNQTIFIQQVAETAERGLKAPVVDPTDINMTLPAKASRVGTVLAFNATTGNPEAGPSIGSVTTVAAQSANINTVATNIASVNTVAGNISNVNTVAGVSSSVSTVAGSISNVNTVADDLNEPTSEINTVAVDIANVNNVGTNISNVNTVAGISANVTTVAGISSNVTTVAGVAAGVTTVAGISSSVTTVAGISANVTTVAGISSNVTTVATNNANVTTVAGSIANVNNVGGNIANVNQVAADTAVINSASANAATATTKAAEALASANSASASAAAASAVALGNEPVRHSVRPSLLLDFANTKTLDPRITFTRASTGTFYDGKTVAKAEENLFERSQEFDNAYWSKGTRATVTANAANAPDGTTTADKLIATATSTAHTLFPSPITLNGQTTVSCFVKAAEYSLFQICSAGNADFDATFNLTAVTATAVIGCTASIVDVGGGWYRCIASNITVTGSRTIAIQGYPVGATASSFGNTYTGNGADGILIWGAQLEQRSSVTAYQPTTTAPITNYIPALQTAASGVARFEHNPVTGESLGLEIEEQRTNLLTYSEDYSNAVWTKSNATILVNTSVAPDGTISADTLVATTTGPQLYQIFTAADNTTYTATAYLKKYSGSDWAYIRMRNKAGANYYFWANLATGASGSTSGSPSATSLTAVGNGWYRISVSGTSGTGATTPYVYISSATGDTVGAAAVNDSTLVWGAQLEAGAFATSFIKTEGSTVTRAVDAASMTGTNFSSWYNTSEGTIYGEGFSSSNAPNIQIASIDDATSNNRIDIRYNGSTLNSSRIVMLVNGTTTVNLTPVGTSLSLNRKISFAMKVNDVAASANASSVFTGTTTAMPIVSRLLIGFATYGTDSNLNGTIKKLAYYPRRLTNAELQGLTTI
jgi:hypothetical protein